MAVVARFFVGSICFFVNVGDFVLFGNVCEKTNQYPMEISYLGVGGTAFVCPY